MFTFAMEQIRKRRLLPRISDTERAALEAGDVWLEAELYRGKPDWERILAEAYPGLDAEAQAFLDGPVETLCGLVDDWEMGRTRRLPPAAWAYLKEHRFFGLVIPREYGGHGMGAVACSAVFGKIATHSMALNAMVFIPNSVGPGELLVEYGTDEQKAHYLPRLAAGEALPCFALTEPDAGSDAASITSRGDLFKGDDGELSIRLNWEKRYITLAPISTLIGLAFQLRDPDNLLGRGEQVGITFALVPADLPGVEIGRYHDPMGIPFCNGPLKGRDVVLPAGQIIGGTAYAGRGWTMLMEALSAGRAISLPGGSAASVKALAREVGAYAAVRKQFGVPIGAFEGIEEPLARIGGWAYLMEAARVFICGAVDSGKKPAVASAIAKYNQTELARKAANDAMDILAGKAVCRGPRNPTQGKFLEASIGITVEGANILTRTLITFGQGALRCHPYLYEAIRAVEADDPRRLRRALLGHAAYAGRNAFRSGVLGMTRGAFARSPVKGPEARYYRKLSWASARFAWLADVLAVSLGPQLKARGKLAGRFADVLSWMLLGTATLRRYQEEGRRPEDLPLLDWSMQYALYQVQLGFEGIYANFDVKGIGPWMRGPAAWWARLNPVGTPPADRLGRQVARILQTPGPQRDRLTGGVLAGAHPRPIFGALDAALEKAVEAAPIEARIAAAARAASGARGQDRDPIEAALAAGVVNEGEARLAREAEALRQEVLAVDDYSPEEYLGRG